MTQTFHERFNILVSSEDAKKRFINRVKNQVLGTFWTAVPLNRRERLKGEILTTLGLLRVGSEAYYWQEIPNNFWLHVQVMQALYDAMTYEQKELGKIIENILSLSEVDLGIRWHNGQLIPSGSPLLDEKLVNDVLRCLQPVTYAGIRNPFNKGLQDLLTSIKEPQKHSDVVTEMYEALEALAKIVTRRDKDLSANMEPFIKAVQISDTYKPILKEYIAYGNKIRHAGKDGQPKPDLTRKEVESFVYMTGVFIRLAVIDEAQA